MNSDKSYNFSEDFITTVIKATEAFFGNETFEKLLQSFEKETSDYYFTRSSETNLIRIILSTYDKVSFLSDCLKFNLLREIVIAIAASSNYLTDIVVRNPEYIYFLFNTDYLYSDLEDESCRKEISEEMNKFRTLTSKLNFLRNYKRRETLKTGVKDILFKTDILKTTEQLSILARSINAELFNLCYREILNKYDLNESSERFCLISLGKLGGNEINYSSDVDLIVFYDSNKIQGRDDISFFDIMNDTTTLFIKHSTEITEKGYIFRVDFRLRPDGRNSPLCRTLNDFMKYYEVKGEDWERQMLIKIGFVCGSTDMYEQFREYIASFIYPSTFTVSPLVQIAKMKANIETRVGESEDVKHFPGGIRDIEFSIQALQLLNGGKIRKIRTGNTLQAIHLLKEKNILKESEAGILADAYVFLRKTEHFLQLMNDLQTHEIPNSDEALGKITAYLGLKNVAEFRQLMAKYRNAVRNFFEELTSQKQDGNIETGFLEKLNFADKIRADKNIKFLRKGTGLLGQKEFDSRTIHLFEKIEPQLISYLSRSIDPDRVLENFVKVIRSVKFPSIWYSEFTNEKFFVSFLTLCEFSQKAIDLMSLNKELGEFFLTRAVFNSEFGPMLPDISNNHIIFALCVQFTLSLIDHQIVSETLGELVLSRIKQATEEKYEKHNFFIAGQGSFGIGEMNFSSDVDMIVIAVRKSDELEIETDFEKFMIESREILNPFTVDFRLRPEGQKGPLVWDIHKYEAYLQNRARIWEFQALTKVCFCTGNTSLYTDFISSIEKRFELFSASELKKGVMDMYKTMIRSNLSQIGNNFNTKKTAGSILNIEFAMQYLLLSNPGEFVKMNCRNNIQKIKFLAGIKPELEFITPFISNFNKLKTLEIALQNMFNQNNTMLPSDKNKKRLLAGFLGYESTEDLDREIKSISSENLRIFEKVFSK